MTENILCTLSWGCTGKAKRGNLGKVQSWFEGHELHCGDGTLCMTILGQQEHITSRFRLLESAQLEDTTRVQLIDCTLLPYVTRLA